MALQKLSADVAAKYDVVENFLHNQKLVFPKQNVHGIGGKPLHKLTLAEVDTLVSMGCLKGVVSLKAKPVSVAAKPIAEPKPTNEGNGKTGK